MTIDSIRRTNLTALVLESGGISRLAEKIGKDPSQVSQWVNAAPDSRTKKPRGIRSTTCRDIERLLGKQEGWMDANHTDIPTPSLAGWPFLSITPERYAQLPDRLKGLIEGRVMAMIEEWLPDEK
ncbi:MAG: hypothetical protein ABN482_09785 [Corticimicrobacter sp.]|uniref:hypothetical protein n=1 Tax=Corticimicrobacter sp. TaxID=2678536 RepID=UPI0032DA5D45